MIAPSHLTRLRRSATAPRLQTLPSPYAPASLPRSILMRQVINWTHDSSL